MSSLKIRVNSPTVKYTPDSIISQYDYQTTKVTESCDSGCRYTVSMK